MGVTNLLKGKEVDLELQTCERDSSIEECVQQMNDKRIGALVVVDKEGFLDGIITERDILKKCVSGKNSRDNMVVADVMTAKDKMVTTQKGKTINDVMALMTKNKVRHIPVVEDGKPTAMISIVDVVKSLLDHALSENSSLKNYIMGAPD